ncbi:MAG: flagellar basal body rod C-terminal domain-containing protein [Candidatus Eisenbacteria bacterium]
MIRPLSATQSALQGLQGSLRRLDRAAETIARAGLDLAPAAPVPTDTAGGTTAIVPATSDDDFLDAMVNMMVAQRAFSAQLRMLETANDMTKEAIELGGRGA